MKFEGRVDTELVERIRVLKKQLGKELVILAHHYQRKEIVELGDHRGDSLALSQRAAENRDARYIVFCGVHFMAESAAILAQPHQSVQIPDREAGCWMSDMADEEVVHAAWDQLLAASGGQSVVPVVYLNSTAGLKAFCGRNGGSVCTSSNATAVFRWGLEHYHKIFFFPDQHLGRNAAHQLGLDPGKVIVWDPQEPLGGNSLDAIQRARLVLWHGYCLVHTRFQPDQVAAMRERFPEARIVVHPECTREVVALADACGSTRFIVDYVNHAPPGATIVVGTEINLVHRLAQENPDKQVFELHYSLCPNMFKINLRKLLETLTHIGRSNVVVVPDSVRCDARWALDRMLALSG